MSNVIMCSECKKCDGDRCNYFDNDSDRESTIACILFEPKNQTVFQQITASPEVLAEQFVIKQCNHFGGASYKAILLKDKYGNYRDFYSRDKAKAATVEYLKQEIGK